MIRKAWPIVTGAALALSACGSESAKQGGASTAEGEVLPGAASDAMLPYSTVKSQAPLAPKSDTGDKTDGSAGGKTPKTSAPSATAKPSPDPAQEPASDPAT